MSNPEKSDVQEIQRHVALDAVVWSDQRQRGSLLLLFLFAGASFIREACEQVFASRATHAWPPLLELPEHRRTGYTKLATDMEVPVTDAADAMTHVRALVERIQASSSRSHTRSQPRSQAT